jgi:nucleoside-diphosphate-sugar epimerase
MNRILITGGSGFIGSAVTAGLKIPLGLGSQTLSIVEWKRRSDGSVLSARNRTKVLDNCRPDIVLHLAWHPTGTSDYEFSGQHTTWAEESLQFARECLSRNIWFICAGSAFDNPLNQNDSMKETPYSRSKSQLRSNIMGLIALGNRVTWLQIHHVFSLEAGRPRLLQSLLTAENPRSYCPDSPATIHDFIELSDVAAAIRLILVRKIMDSVAIGSGWAVSNQSFIDSAKFALGISNTRPSVPRTKSGHSSISLRLAGWRPHCTNEFFGLMDSETSE